MQQRLFPSQLDNEVIHLVVREHWFFLFLRTCIWVLFAAVPVIFRAYGPQYFPGLFEGTAAGYVALALNIYILLLTLGLFMIWTLYYLNVQIVTNKRVVDINQYAIFRQKISELLLPNIEDVTSEVKGFFGTVLEYGDILIQTAGEKDNFRFDRIPNPRAVAKLISNLLEQGGIMNE